MLRKEYTNIIRIIVNILQNILPTSSKFTTQEFPQLEKRCSSPCENIILFSEDLGFEHIKGFGIHIPYGKKFESLTAWCVKKEVSHLVYLRPGNPSLFARSLITANTCFVSFPGN